MEPLWQLAGMVALPAVILMACCSCVLIVSCIREAFKPDGTDESTYYERTKSTYYGRTYWDWRSDTPAWRSDMSSWAATPEISWAESDTEDAKKKCKQRPRAAY